MRPFDEKDLGDSQAYLAAITFEELFTIQEQNKIVFNTDSVHVQASSTSTHHFWV